MKGYAGPVLPRAPQPQSAPTAGLYVPRTMVKNEAKLPFQPAVGDRSLQINIDSADDAKSVIQNLPAIKAAYDAAGATSVEFCIAEAVVAEVGPIMTGAINWCRTYVKHIPPNPGNILFPLPSYKDLAPRISAAAEPAPTPTPAAAPQTPVKPQRPVNAAAGGT